MDGPPDSPVTRTVRRCGRRLRRLLWNGTERRPRAPVRLGAGLLLLLFLAGAGNQYRPAPLRGDEGVARAINMLTRQAPNAAGLVAAVVVAAVLVDRRRLTDLGLDLDRGWWRGLAGGTALGAGIALSTVAVGLAAGFYEFVGVRTGVGIGPWIPVAVGAVLFQLLFVVPEELFVRGYVITNVVEGLDGASWASRRTAAGVGIAVSSAFFYLTHAAAKGTAFGLMVAALSLLLGLGYVLSGDLSVPVGIHFGVNIGGVLAGTNPQRASLLELSAASTVQESIVLPVEAVVARMGAAVVAVAALCLWYRAADGGIRVTPAIARPLLRRDESRASADD